MRTIEGPASGGHVFGDDMIASAVLDRVFHHGHVLLIQRLLGSSKYNP